MPGGWHATLGEGLHPRGEGLEESWREVADALGGEWAETGGGAAAVAVLEDATELSTGDTWGEWGGGEGERGGVGIGGVEKALEELGQVR